MSCYVTMPNPSHTGVQRTRDPLTPEEGPRRENTYGNLGNFGSYAAMRKMYLPERKHRYIYEARSKGGCCNPPPGEHHHHKHHHKHPGLGDKCQPSVKGKGCVEGVCINETTYKPVGVGESGICMQPHTNKWCAGGKVCQNHHISFQTQSF